MIAEFHAKAIQAMEGAQLIGVYCRDPEKAKSIRSIYPCQIYSDLDELLGNKDLDIVTIATPSGAHLDAIIQAAKKGKHIVCEKPLEISPQRVLDAEKIAQENGVVLGGIFNRRFNPAVAAIKKAVTDQRFGVISLCEVQVKWFRDQAYYDSGAWRGTWQLDGGGVLMNQSIHTIDLFIHFMGMPKRLTASIDTLTHENIEVEDTAVALLEFENGAKGVIQGSTSTWSSEGRPAEIQISGDAGAVILQDENIKLWDFKATHESDVEIAATMKRGEQQALGANDPSHINYLGHQRNFENFVAAVDGTESLLITSEEAIKSVIVIDAIYESAKSDGTWIEINIPK